MGYLQADVPVGHPDFGKAFPCECRRAEIEARRLANLRRVSNLEALSYMTFATFKTEMPGTPEDIRQNLRHASEMAKTFAASPRGWLVLRGGYGCGKTHLAAAIANERLARGEPVLFVIVPDLLDHLRAAFHPSSEELPYDQEFETVRAASLLILDDLGTQNTTAWAEEKLYQIINYRYNARLPTVITTNQEDEQIDPRLYSRMVDPHLSNIVTILAPDHRVGGVSVRRQTLSSLSAHRDQTFKSFNVSSKGEQGARKDKNLEQARDLAMNYAENPKDWLVFTGDYGCGKTHLAAAIANHREEKGLPALFIVVPDLLDHLRATFSPDSPVSYDRLFVEIKEAPLLILDDLGTESATSWAREKLFQLLDYRYASRKPTVITLADKTEVDPRLKSRLLDMARCEVHRIDASSYRDSEQREAEARSKRPTRGQRRAAK
jgi:DNA replication protein DnaC